MNISKLAVIMLCISLLPACATITRGTTDVVEITSDPTQATVTTDLGYNGRTSCSIEHKRKRSFIVTVEMDGYETETIFVDNKWDGKGTAGMAGNIIFGGIIGIGVDSFSGATMGHYPNKIHVDLKPLTEPSVFRGDTGNPGDSGDPGDTGDLGDTGDPGVIDESG